MGVDTDFYRAPSDAERQAARSHLELDPDSLVTVLPARMNTSKGHDIAAAAFRLVRQRRPASRPVCLFAGAGDQRDAIEADVLRDDADRATFRFLGFVDRTRLRDAYWASDIVLLPSRIEGFGLVVAEAMCCGAIVIRTPSGGWQDQVIEGETGFMVPFDDPAALATAIEKVLDAPDRATMRANAIQVASTSFARAAMIAGTSALYREEAARTRARRGRISSAQSS
jgi:glycosyltransferase involved in cell wall biosynthesis